MLLQFVDHPADFCFRLPDHLSHEEGAMVEPLSVGVHAVRRAGVSPGKTVAIMGAGPIGEAMHLSFLCLASCCVEMISSAAPANVACSIMRLPMILRGRLCSCWASPVLTCNERHRSGVAVCVFPG